MRRPYPSYRDSGVEWLGEVPEHWQVKRLKCVTSINDDALRDDEDPLRPITYVDIGSVDSIRGITETMQMVFEDAPSRARRLVQDGDTIVSTVRTYLRAIAPVRQPPSEMVVSTGFAVVRPQEVASSFAYWTLREHGFVEEIVAQSVGVSYPAINAQDISELPIPVPPVEEQRAISTFLDRETGKIDSLVVKKRMLIERLDEYRTALITRTVTRGLPPSAARVAGLDPTPRLKPSSIEWLGDVPEHWQVKPLAYIASYRTSSVDKKTSDDESPVRLCNYTDVYYQNRIHASNGEFMRATASPQEITRFKLNAGDVLITKDSEDWKDIAVPALVEETAEDFVCGYHLGILRPNAATIPAFLYRAMQSEAVNRQLQVAATGVTRYGVPNPAVGEALIPLPPLEEQRAIASFLDHSTERIDRLRLRVEAAIERLQEWRTALITAAVTGKIDVRDRTSSRPEAAAKPPPPGVGITEARDAPLR